MADNEDEGLAEAFVARPTIDLFISYRRSDGAGHAVALRKWLRSYRLPASLQSVERSRQLDVFLDEVNIRASNDYFKKEIIPALGRSRYFLIVQTPSALEPADDGGPNWLVRELRVFRNGSNPRRDQIVAAAAGGELGDPLPDGLDRQLPRIERLDLGELTSWFRWWPPKRLRIESELLPLLATLRKIAPEEMPALRREVQRSAANRLVAMLASAFAASLVLTIALVWALAKQVEATQASFQTRHSQVEASRSAANTLVLLAETARRDGDYLGAIRLLSEAQFLAWTPRVQAAALTLEAPLAIFDRALEFSSWKVAFSAENKLALGGFDGSVVVYDPERMTYTTARKPDRIPVVGLTFEPRGSLLVVLRAPAIAAWTMIGSTKNVSRIDRIMPSGAVVTLEPPPSGAHWLSVGSSKNGQVLVAGADDGVWLRDQKTDGWLRLDDDQRGDAFRPPVSVAVSSDGRYVASASINGMITVWQLSDRQVLGQWQATPPEGLFPYHPFKLAFSEPGPALMFGSFDGSVNHWLFTEEPRPSAFGKPHEQSVTTVAVSADGQLLATGGWDATAAVMETRSVTSAQQLTVGTEGLRAGVMDIALAPNGTWLATTEAVPAHRGGEEPGGWLFGRVRLWLLRGGDGTAPTTRHDPWWKVDFDRSGGLLSAIGDRSVRLVREDHAPVEVASAPRVWDPVTASQVTGGAIRTLSVGDSGGREGDYMIAQFNEPPGSIVSGSFAFSPGGQRAAHFVAEVDADGLALIDARILLLDVETGALLHQRQLPLAAIRAFGPLKFIDEDTVVAALTASPQTPDGKRGSHLWRWTVPSNALEALVSLETQPIFDIAVSEDNGLIAISDDSRSVMVFDFTGREIWRADEGPRLAGSPAHLVFSPDGQALYAASFAQLDGWRISEDWKAISGSVDLDFKPEDMEFDPSGRLLMVADWNGVLRFFDPSTLVRISELQLGIGSLLKVSVSPDGKRLAVIGVGGVRVLGGVLPQSIGRAERISRLTLRAGALTRVDAVAEARLASRYPATATRSTPSPADVEFLQLLREGGVAVHKPETSLDWLRATEPLMLSPEMEKWLGEHPDHAFSSNMLQWSER